jgi:hypothetical protein
MALHLKKNQLHKDVGKPAGERLTGADLAAEKARGGVYARRAQFATNAKQWRHPIKGKH